MSASDSSVVQNRYFVLHNGEAKGPFDLDMIEAFVLSGHYPRGVQICAQGSNQWKSHSLEVKVAPPPLPQQSTRPIGSKPTARILKWILVGGGALGFLALMKIAGPSGGTSSSQSSNYAPSTSATSTGALYNRVDGRTYRVPNSEHYRLLTQKKALEQEEALVTGAESRLDAEQSTLEQQRAYLDRTNQYEIENFNAKIDALNAKRSQVRRQIATFNAHVDAFNADLARVGTPIR